jgi:hypothetical protein
MLSSSVPMIKKRVERAADGWMDGWMECDCVCDAFVPLGHWFPGELGELLKFRLIAHRRRRRRRPSVHATVYVVDRE